MATGKRKGAMQVKEPMKVKGPTDVNFTHGGGQNCFRSLRSRSYTLLSHFQNDGATVECSTLQIQLPIRSINQSINKFISRHIQRRVLQCGYAESKRNILRRILSVLTDGAVRQFSGREFQSFGAATEKRRAAVSKLCGGTDRSFCVDDRSKRD